jgi:Ca2+-binding EF-hand superfamily protein
VLAKTMKVWFAAVFIHAISVAVGLSVNQLVGLQKSEGHAESNHDTLAPANLGTDIPGCTSMSIKPVSLLQKAMHPWTGNYEHTTHCQEVATLKNTAEPSTCNTLFWFFWFTVVFGIFFGALCVVACGPIGLNFFLIPLAVVWYYMITTGLFEDYKSGAMSWSVNAVQGIQPHNVSPECLQFVSFSYVMSLLIFVYVFLFGCVFGLPIFIISRMQAETKATMPFLSEADREFLASQEFRTKCVKAFNEADADHNGVLDLNELQHVLLFDLTDEEKQYVQETSMWKQAFEQCDADNSKTIDQSEFVEVMKFVYTKAKYGVKKAEP